MSVELSKQKLDLDSAINGIQVQIKELEHRYKVLVRGMEAINNGENMLESNSKLAQEVREIMRNPLDN